MKITLSQAFAIAIIGQVLYHLAQKLIAPNANPILATLVFYTLASLMCGPLLFLFPINGSLRDALSEMNWAVLGVALAIVLIEIGFLLIYRVGGALSTSFVITASVTTALMALIGVGLLKENFSLTKLAGVALCLGGIVLITRAG
jgi:drug/metabolite transporter (DMT)-like permease